MSVGGHWSTVCVIHTVYVKSEYVFSEQLFTNTLIEYL